ncbi:hypothetical protein D3C87_2054960 [compost metagenome]
MMPAALRKSSMVSNSGITISSMRAGSVLLPSVPCSMPDSFCSSMTSTRSDSVSVCEMM